MKEIYDIINVISHNDDRNMMFNDAQVQEEMKERRGT